MKIFLFLLSCALGTATWLLKEKCEDLLLAEKITQAQQAKLTERLGSEQREHEARASNLVQENASLRTKLEALTGEYESFKIKRRMSMVGRVFPQVLLPYGKKIPQAKIIAVSAAMITFESPEGISKVRLSDLDDDFKWDAVWTEKEAQEELKRIRPAENSAAKL